MNYATALECHRQPLLRIVATLFAMIGLVDDGMVERLSRPVYRKVLNLLRPAEAAVRRLIIVMARGLVVTPRAARADSARRATSRKGKGKGKSRSRRSFPLFDPLVRVTRGFGRPKPTHPAYGPRIRSLASDPLVPWFLRPAPPQPKPEPKPEPDDTVSAVSLCHRLAAIKHALEDLQRQAMRYARWRDKPIDERRPPRETALRRGAPPGLREKSKHEVHEILKECHWLVRTVGASDTS